MNASKIPLMFRAQIRGRCQLQYLPRYEEADSVKWVDEWTDKAYPQSPQFGNDVESRSYQVSWRFVTNGGQDEGIIRPVIGAYGWPFYPGSSMKGVFRQACRELEQSGDIPDGMSQHYCGDDKELTPGVLRFHGGYPENQEWTQRLIDVVHPQQNWQLETEDTEHKKGGAFAQVSLYQPTLKFGISAIASSEVNWDLVWQIWEHALTKGLGCRVSSGYGQFEQSSTKTILTADLKGQGVASHLIDNTLEFRPNVFRAAIRGHAMRIFGGLTTERDAIKAVEQLFGGISRGGAQWGLLLVNFTTQSLKLFEDNQTYRVEGRLSWSLSRSLSEQKETALQKLIKGLMQFAMLFGGFGKSWRRADHRLFLPDYTDHCIGCHWQWNSPESTQILNPVMRLSEVSMFIDSLQQTALEWMRLQGITSSPTTHVRWRETWHRENVQVWGRVAGSVRAQRYGKDDSKAIAWFHGCYGYDYINNRMVEKTIKNSSVTGKLNQVGRIWHRMYPKVGLFKNPQDESSPLVKVTPLCLELLTLFPDSTHECQNFQEFLHSENSGFKLLWGQQ